MSNDNVSKIKKHSQKLHFDTKSVRNNIIYVLIGSIGFTSVLITFSPDDKKAIICDIIEPLAAAIAVGLSILVVYRQKKWSYGQNIYFSWCRASAVFNCRNNLELLRGRVRDRKSISFNSRRPLANWLWTIIVFCI